MHANASLILLCLWAGLSIAVPLRRRLVRRQGRIALSLLALGAIWFGAVLPLELHDPGFVFASLLSFHFGWIGHWLFPVPAHGPLAFAVVLTAGALSAVINVYPTAGRITATSAWLNRFGLRRCGRTGGSP